MLNPRVDFAFKKLFGVPENKDLLISFVNAIVSAEDQVVDLVLLNPYNEQEHYYDKLSILDIKASDSEGRQYNIEMQIADQEYYSKRALYYWAKLYTGQLKKGDSFANLEKAICINILNFNTLDTEPGYHHTFKILHNKSYKNYFTNFEIHFIELSKLDQNLSHIKTTLDRWVNFLNKANLYNQNNFPQELSTDPAINKAFLVLNTLYLNDEEREIYEARLKWWRDENAALQKAHNTGFKEGKFEGKLEGKLEKAIEIAKSMLMQGYDINTIAKITDLSLDELKKLDVLIFDHGPGA